MPIPDAFGPYEIRAPLGRGGMGEVYRGWDPRLEREVAVKRLRERRDATPERVERFLAEARAASALNHPNILTVYDAGVDGVTPYLVTELIDGEPLSAEIRRGPVPIRRLLDLATQIADGLAEAHGAGIVHGDLKPDNLMVTRAGRAKILDFGLARAGARESPGAGVPASIDQTETAPGLVGGTAPYMSPEQARGGLVDVRSDQFSFGLVLYEMATGRAAFHHDTPAATLDAIINDEPAPVGSINAQTPLLLAWIIERCLAKDPADRYGVTADLHRDLRMLRDRLAEAVARESAPARPGRRTASLAGATAAVLATGVAALLLWRVAAMPPTFDPAAMRFLPLATESLYEAFPAWSPDGQTVAYVAEADGVLQVFTRKLSSPVATQVTRAAYDAKYPFWSPDGRQIYYISLVGNQDGLWSIGSAGGRPSNVLRNVTRAAISPDGLRLAFFRDDEDAGIVGTAALWFADATGDDQQRHERRYAQPPLDDMRFTDGSLAFSPDGRLGICAVPLTIALAPARRDWQLWVVPPDGAPVQHLARESGVSPRLTNLSWMPDGRHVLLGLAQAGRSGAQLLLADLETDRLWPIAPGTASAYAPAVSSDGRIAFTSGEPDYDLYELPIDGTPPRPLITTSRNESDAVWAPDGQAFAYVTDRAGPDEIWRRRIDDAVSDMRLVDFGVEPTNMVASLSFSPDGQRLAYQRNALRPIWPLRIWHSLVGSGQPSPLLPERYDGYQDFPSWSPDGEWIAFSQWSEGRWRLMKMRVGTTGPPEELRSDGVASAAPRWSPDGAWITWETVDAFMLVSPDGAGARQVDAPPWLVHTWAADGSELYGIAETAGRRLELSAVNIRTGRERRISDLGASPPVNNPVKGLSFSAARRSLLTGLVRMRGDIWILEGVRPPRGLVDRLWPR